MNKVMVESGVQKRLIVKSVAQECALHPIPAPPSVNVIEPPRLSPPVSVFEAHMAFMKRKEDLCVGRKRKVKVL